MYKDATNEQIEKVISIAEDLGYTALPNPGARRMVINIAGDVDLIDTSRFQVLPGVLKVIKVIFLNHAKNVSLSGTANTLDDKILSFREVYDINTDMRFWIESASLCVMVKEIRLEFQNDLLQFIPELVS